MVKIIEIIEAELKRQEEMISLLKWENEDLKERLKELEGGKGNATIR